MDASTSSRLACPKIYPSRSFAYRCDSPAAFRSTQIASSSTPSRKSPRAPGSQFSPSSKRIDFFWFAKMFDLLDGGIRHRIALSLPYHHSRIYSPSTPGPLVAVLVFITLLFVCLLLTFVPTSLQTKYITKHNPHDPFYRLAPRFAQSPPQGLALSFCLQSHTGLEWEKVIRSPLANLVSARLPLYKDWLSIGVQSQPSNHRISPSFQIFYENFLRRVGSRSSPFSG